MALSCAVSTAAASGSAGTDFWLGFPDAASSGTPQFTLAITATAAATGTVTVPGTSFSQGFSVTPGSAAEVAIPLTTEETTNDSVETGHAIHVVADQPVSVDAQYLDSGLSDGYLGLATGTLGTAYSVGAAPGTTLCGASEFELVGTQDATTVTITPSVAIGAHPAGTAYTENLDAGSTYLGQASGASDVSSTLVSADKPVAVIAGSACGQVPAATSFANALMEEEPPIAQWGTEFFALPFATRTKGDEYVLMTSQTDTTITVNGQFFASIAPAFASTTTLRTDPVHITADKPILVVHLATGYDYNNDNHGDPTMIVVPPVSRYARAQTVSTPSSGFAQNYLNVSIAGADVKTLTLDGQPVPAADFNVIGDSTTESGAQIPVQGGAHTLAAAGPFAVEAYGFDATNVDAYGFPGAFGDGSRAPDPAITVTTPATGATYGVGQIVDAAYGCSAAFGTTIAACAGTLPSGAAIVTSSPGPHTFTVLAVDGYGDHSTQTVTYLVVNKVSVKVQKPDVKTGDQTVTVAVPGPGTLTGTETATGARAASKRAPLVVARVRRAVTKAGKVRLTFRPSRKAKAILKKRHKLAVVIKITYTPSHGQSHTTTVHATLRLKAGR